MSVGLIALILSAVIGLVFGIRSLTASKRESAQLFLDRESLTPDEIFSRYYATSGLPRDSVLTLWAEFTEKLEIPPGKLRPHDRFDTQLGVSGFLASLDDPRDELARHVLAKAKQLGVKLDLHAVETVNDLIRVLAAPVPQKPEGPEA